MDTIKNAADYASDKINEATSGASKKANKEVMKDGDAPTGTRLTAAKDAAKDKIDEHSYESSAKLNKEQMKH